jgi:Arginyl tRNA synthetase N terminal domain
MQLTIFPPPSRAAIMIVLWCSVNVRIGAGFGPMSRFNRNGVRNVIANKVTPSTWQRPLLRSSLEERHFALFSTTSEKSNDTSTGNISLYGINWVKDSVVASLNDLFDPKEVAKGNALAKLNKPQKKKKKKKGQEDAGEPEPEEPGMSEEEKNAIIEAAISEAKPFSHEDVMVTPATKDEFGDYQCNAAMGLAKAVGMNPR